MRLQVFRADPEDTDTEGNPIGEGWFGEYSAPGFMDRTDPCGPFEGPIEAALGTCKLYGDFDEPHSADRRECAEVIRRIRAARAGRVAS